MAHGFNKIFSSITESTVWVEPYATRICWVAMLANADENGRIYASVPGLAKLAGITLPEAEAALQCFLSPDKYSRSKEHDGRRIVEIDGGWELLNHRKYRDLRSKEDRREYQREWDRQHRPSGYARSGQSTTVRQSPTESDAVRSVRPNPTKAEAEAEEEKNKDIVRQTPPDPSPAPAVKAEKAARREAAKRVLAFLNEKCGRAFEPVEKTLVPIEARLSEGYTEVQCRQVIVRKLDQWGSDPRMAPYLRPKTLFGPENFANYRGELVVPKEVTNG